MAPELNAPMVLFTYFNPLLCRGFEKVIKQIADAGVKGELAPSLAAPPSPRVAYTSLYEFSCDAHCSVPRTYVSRRHIQNTSAVILARDAG